MPRGRGRPKGSKKRSNEDEDFNPSQRKSKRKSSESIIKEEECNETPTPSIPPASSSSEPVSVPVKRLIRVPKVTFRALRQDESSEMKRGGGNNRSESVKRLEERLKAYQSVTQVADDGVLIHSGGSTYQINKNNGAPPVSHRLARVMPKATFGSGRPPTSIMHQGDLWESTASWDLEGTVSWRKTQNNNSGGARSTLAGQTAPMRGTRSLLDHFTPKQLEDGKKQASEVIVEGVVENAEETLAHEVQQPKLETLDFPYKCFTCDVAFAKEPELETHFKIYHSSSVPGTSSDPISSVFGRKPRGTAQQDAIKQKTLIMFPKGGNLNKINTPRVEVGKKSDSLVDSVLDRTQVRKPVNCGGTSKSLRLKSPVVKTAKREQIREDVSIRYECRLCDEVLNDVNDDPIATITIHLTMEHTDVVISATQALRTVSNSDILEKKTIGGKMSHRCRICSAAFKLDVTQVANTNLEHLREDHPNLDPTTIDCVLEPISDMRKNADSWLMSMKSEIKHKPESKAKKTVTNKKPKKIQQSEEPTKNPTPRSSPRVQKNVQKEYTEPFDVPMEMIKLEPQNEHAVASQDPPLVYDMRTASWNDKNGLGESMSQAFRCKLCKLVSYVESVALSHLRKSHHDILCSSIDRMDSFLEKIRVLRCEKKTNNPTTSYTKAQKQMRVNFMKLFVTGLKPNEAIVQYSKCDDSGVKPKKSCVFGWYADYQRSKRLEEEEEQEEDPPQLQFNVNDASNTEIEIHTHETQVSPPSLTKEKQLMRNDKPNTKPTEEEEMRKGLIPLSHATGGIGYTPPQGSKNIINSMTHDHIGMNLPPELKKASKANCRTGVCGGALPPGVIRTSKTMQGAGSVSHQMTVFECEKCPAVFIERQAIIKHMQKKHDIYMSTDVSFKCAHCTLMFADRNHLNDHMLTKHALPEHDTDPKCSATAYMKVDQSTPLSLEDILGTSANHQNDDHP